jgi:hypothetical protein
MNLEAETNGAFKQVWTKSGDQGNKWQQASVDIGSDVTGLRFKATTGRGFRSDFALDDISSSAASKPTGPTPPAAKSPTAQPTANPTPPPATPSPTRTPTSKPATGSPTSQPSAPPTSSNSGASQQKALVAAAADFTKGLESSLDGVAAAVPQTKQGVVEVKGGLQKIRTALNSAFPSAAAASSLAQLLGDDEVEHPSGDCSELHGIARTFCEKREVAHRSEVDPSVRIVGDEAITENEISISITDPDPSVSEYQYVQFTSDQLRSAKDAIILVPADAAADENLETAALRKVLVPAINPMSRSTDTFGVIAMHLNPDLSPDAKQRTKIQAIAPGAYKLAYVRELATSPQQKYVFSEVFQVQAGLPSRPGSVTVGKDDGKVQLSWKASLFDGGSSSVLYEVQYCSPDGDEEDCAWAAVGDPTAETSLTLTDMPDGCSSGCRFRSRATNEHGYSQPSFVLV